MIGELKMLLCKDFRLSLIPLLAGIMFITIPYLLLLIPFLIQNNYDFRNAWGASVVFSPLTMAFLAGNIIACERTDRSATFLAFQGASRKMVVSSKIIICVIAFIFIYIISFLLSFFLPEMPLKEIVEILKINFIFAAVGFCWFGCCWLLSSLLSSPAISIALGLLSPFIIGISLAGSLYVFHLLSEDMYGVLFIALNIVVGLISLIAGTWYFVRSKES